MEPQQWQIDHGLIPAPGARAKAKALLRKRREKEEYGDFAIAG
jgi:hypothetical protein